MASTDQATAAFQADAISNTRTASTTKIANKIQTSNVTPPSLSINHDDFACIDRRYMKGEIYQELYGNPSQPAAASSSSPSIASAASSSSLEPWHAPKPSQEFQEEYEGAWQRLWPQLNSELSRAGPLAQQTAESFRQILDTPKRRSLSPEGLMKGIENQIYKAESRNSVDKLSNFLIPVTSAQ
eukprot:TRINITY_DN22994_c0_g1_i2.p1 TRINITY_DN22994_c0_g1~~TRINITY_DN22994_c0_g1_i2.p1  ORF type:complete len:184 (+),score=39.74 TRINITY_DN22994_c0_g1_i2:260-811(+)